MTDLCNRPSSRLGEQLSGHRRRKGAREEGNASGWQTSLPFKVKIEFL